MNIKLGELTKNWVSCPRLLGELFQKNRVSWCRIAKTIFLRNEECSFLVCFELKAINHLRRKTTTKLKHVSQTDRATLIQNHKFGTY